MRDDGFMYLGLCSLAFNFCSLNDKRVLLRSVFRFVFVPIESILMYLIYSDSTLFINEMCENLMHMHGKHDYRKIIKIN